MSSQDVQLTEALSAAQVKLEQLVRAGRFPDIQAPIEALLQDIAALQSDQATDDEMVRNASDSVNRLYRTSMAQANASPQKYQQPVFQCYGDYQKCMAKQASTSGKALCVTLFVLSLADNLISLSIPS